MKTIFAFLAILAGITVLWSFRDKIIGWLSKPDELASKINALLSPPKSSSEQPTGPSDHPKQKVSFKETEQVDKSSEKEH